MNISHIIGQLYMRRAALPIGRRRVGATVGREQINSGLYRSPVYDSITFTLVHWWGVTTLIWRLR